MRKFILLFKKSNRNVLVDYNEAGDLVKYSFNGGDVMTEQMTFLFKRFPFKIDTLEQWRKIENVQVTEVLEDISFEAFWERYNHKFGNKKRAQTLYSCLKEDEKIGAINGINRYDAFLKMNIGVAKAFPETYLHQKRWQN